MVSSSTAPSGELCASVIAIRATHPSRRPPGGRLNAHFRAAVGSTRAHACTTLATRVSSWVSSRPVIAASIALSGASSARDRMIRKRASARSDASGIRATQARAASGSSFGQRIAHTRRTISRIAPGSAVVSKRPTSGSPSFSSRSGRSCRKASSAAALSIPCRASSIRRHACRSASERCPAVADNPSLDGPGPSSARTAMSPVLVGSREEWSRPGGAAAVLRGANRRSAAVPINRSKTQPEVQRRREALFMGPRGSSACGILGGVRESLVRPAPAGKPNRERPPGDHGDG